LGKSACQVKRLNIGQKVNAVTFHPALSLHALGQVPRSGLHCRMVRGPTAFWQIANARLYSVANLNWSAVRDGFNFGDENEFALDTEIFSNPPCRKHTGEASRS
jgi:hypothetical protein